MLLMADMSGVRADGVGQGDDSVKFYAHEVDTHGVMLDAHGGLLLHCAKDAKRRKLVPGAGVSQGGRGGGGGAGGGERGGGGGEGGGESSGREEGDSSLAPCLAALNAWGRLFLPTERETQAQTQTQTHESGSFSRAFQGGCEVMIMYCTLQLAHSGAMAVRESGGMATREEDVHVHDVFHVLSLVHELLCAHRRGGGGGGGDSGHGAGMRGQGKERWNGDRLVQMASLQVLTTN